ncbi:hypothetical protein [Microbacterium laevaniformans]|uniref:hypothetical protein n=1 Tax=Microbacterium laevaniformans TaxID=36807 RepID=UPI00363DEDB8
MTRSEAAAQIAVLVHAGAGEPAEAIGLLSPDGVLDQSLDRETALALAARLIELSRQLPEPPRLLRRQLTVDAELASRDL